MDPATDWVIDGGKYTLDFDGSNDYAATALSAPTSQMTFAVWAKPRSVGITSRVCGDADYYGGQRGTSLLFFGTQRIYWVLRGGTAFDLDITGLPIITNQWTHVVCSLGDAPRMIVNGKLVGTGTGTTFGSWNRRWLIGADDPTGGVFQGPIDDCMIWNRPLSISEALQLYQLGRGGMYVLRPPKKYWNFKYESQKPRKSQQIIIKHDSPSFENGFAPRDGEALYPNLLKGLVGAWCPSLGITGGILRDVSGRNNHGTLTNMDPATDWVQSGGAGALDFDGVNDVVTASSAGFALAAPFTISVWYNPRTRKQYAGIVSTMTAFDETSTNGWVLYDGAASNAGNIALICGGARIETGGNNSTLNAWQHYVAVVNGTGSKIYKNAVVVASGTTGAPSYASTPTIKIGSFIASNGPSDSLIDDVALFRREVTPPEIQQLYQLGRGGLFALKSRRITTTIPARIPNSRSSLITRPPIEASYENGFAPRDGEPLYPNLFNGLAGAWCPSMGVTGDALRDLSGRGNHGVFTNMNPTTAWDTYQGQYALNFTNANGQPEQYIDAGTMQFDAFNYPFSMMCWVRNLNIVSNDTSPFSKTSVTNGYAGPMIWINGGVVNAYWAGGVKAAGTTIVSSRLDWCQLGICWTGNQARAIVNGRIDGVGNTTSRPNAANQSINIGRYIASFNRTMIGQVDDCAIWRRCLTPQEWQQLYQLGRGGMFRLKRPTARKTISLPATWLKVGDEWTETQPKIATGSKASLITRPPIEPSYENGFAPRDGEPLYPNLFKGLVGAWCPSMGVTGNTLRDLSGQNNHGTLTNMDPSTDWVVSGGQYALDFDGANDYVANRRPQRIAGAQTQYTITFWVKLASNQYGKVIDTGDFLSGLIVYAATSGLSGGIQIATGGTYPIFSTQRPVVNVWCSIGVTVNNKSVSLFLNGVQGASGTCTSDPAFNGANWYLGGTGGAETVLGQIDDFAVWNRALSPNEIRQLYQLGRGGMFTLKPKTIALPTSTIWQPSQSRLYTGEWK